MTVNQRLNDIPDQELREAIQGVKPRTRLYRILKEELAKLGYWKNQPRGNPRKGFAATHNKGRQSVD